MYYSPTLFLKNTCDEVHYWKSLQVDYMQVLFKPFLNSVLRLSRYLHVQRDKEREKNLFSVYM